jgi:RimJ/RimL family protein N-acetyltransferase
MDHSIRVECRLFALRPVAVADAEFILSLRLDPELSRFLDETSPSVTDQENWLRDYLRRADDYYFIIEETSSHLPVGTIAIYSLDLEHRRAEWGRWIIRPPHAAAVESALLIYTVAFENLQLEEVYCRSQTANRQVVSFHSSCGLATRSVGELTATIRGQACSVTEQYLTRESWPRTRHKLDALAARLAAAPRGAELVRGGRA